MANIVLYSLLVTLCVSLHASTGLPVRAEHHADCVQLFRNLLQNVAGLFTSEPLCYGITSNKVALRNPTETVQACTPNTAKNSSCVLQRNASFSENECRKNIMKDLAYYDMAIEYYLKSKLRHHQEVASLLDPTLRIIHKLRKNCSINPNENYSVERAAAAQMWSNESFSNRQEMCKLMRGFHVRTITMNRAILYMSSGDHQI